MKRLIVLTAAAMLTASASGCWHLFNRGAACNTCPPTGATFGDPYMSAPAVLPSDSYALPGPQ